MINIYFIRVDCSETITFPAIFACTKWKVLNEHHALFCFEACCGERICSTDPHVCCLGSESSWHQPCSALNAHAAVEAEQSLALGIFCRASCNKLTCDFVRYFQKGSTKPWCVSASKYYLM